MFEAIQAKPTTVNAEIPQDSENYMPTILTAVGTAMAGLMGWFGKAWKNKDKQANSAMNKHIDDLKDQREELMTLVVDQGKIIQKVAMDSTIAINNSNRIVEENTRATRELTTQSKMNQHALSKLSCVQEQQRTSSKTDTIQGE